MIIVNLYDKQNRFFYLSVLIVYVLFSYLGSAFKQQKLPAWQPILTAGTVLPTFFLIGIAFIPIGIGLLISANRVSYSRNLSYIILLNVLLL